MSHTDTTKLMFWTRLLQC